MKRRICWRWDCLIIFIIVALFHPNINAATLIEFDEPYLIVEEAGGKYNGYYSLSLPAVDGVRASASCRFFFKSENRSASGARFKINTFFTADSYKHRHILEDLPGELLIDGDSWTIQMEEVPGGCLTAAGGGFQKDAAIPNIIQKRTPIVGILIAKKKTHFYDVKNIKFVKRKGFLIPGDVIIALNKKDDFYFVRFLNDQSDELSTGWVKMSDTMSPFLE